MAIKTHIKYGWFIPLLLLAVYGIAKSAEGHIGDFGNYYYASKFLLQGRWGIWIYDPASFNLAVYAEGQRHFFLNYTPVPPLSALIYLPFAATDIGTAKIVWNSLNVLLLSFSLYRLQNYFRINAWLMLFVPLLFFTPIRNTLYEGQSYFLLFFLLSEGLICYLEQKKWMAVLLWALSIHLKISPAFVLLFLLFEKDWRSVWKLTAITALLLLLSVPFLGVETWINYSFNILPRLFSGEINNTYAVNYQSMQVLLKTLFVPDLMHNPAAWVDNPVAYQKLSGAFHLLIYGLAALCSFTKVKQEVKFSTWLLCSMLVSGYGNSFSLVLLMLPLCCFHVSVSANKAGLLAVAGLLFIACNVPLHWFSSFPVPLQFPRLYLLLVLFFSCVIFIKPVIKPYYLIALLTALFIPVHRTTYAQNYFLPWEEHVLIYDFKLQQDSLIMMYFDDSGPQQKTITLGFPLTQVNEIPAGSLSSASEHIPISKQINDSLIIYLSDKNRGVGFYTLRYELLK